MKALVAGAGIGGLAAAISLRAKGHDVTVLERAASLEAAGYGIALSPNAMQALAKLRLADTVLSAGAHAEHAQIRTPAGGVLNEIDFDGGGIVGVHRAELQRILLQAAGDVVLLGREVTGFRADSDGVTAVSADGSEDRGDLLVGADGINSAVRAQLHGPGELRYAGHSGWRASVSFDDPSLRARVSETWGRGARFGLVPIGNGRLYWFVAESAPAGAPPPPEGPKRAFQHRFRDWHHPIPAVIDSTDEQGLSRTDVFDRKPLKRWGEGRVTLLGDAAHPMTPNLGQGAGQALEDAVILGNRLADERDPEAGLRAYEAQRIPRTTTIVRLSWQLGRMAQLENPLAIRARNALLKATPRRVQQKQNRRVISVSLD